MQIQDTGRSIVSISSVKVPPPVSGYRAPTGRPRPASRQPDGDPRRREWAPQGSRQRGGSRDGGHRAGGELFTATATPGRGGGHRSAGPAVARRTTSVGRWPFSPPTPRPTYRVVRRCPCTAGRAVAVPWVRIQRQHEGDALMGFARRTGGHRHRRRRRNRPSASRPSPRKARGSWSTTSASVSAAPGGRGSAPRPSSTKIRSAGGRGHQRHPNVTDWGAGRRVDPDQRSARSAGWTCGEQRPDRARPDDRQHQRGASSTPSSPSTSGTSPPPATPVPTGLRTCQGRQEVDAGSSTPAPAPDCRAALARAITGAAKAGIAALTLVAAAEMGALRGDRQRDRPVGPHPDDRDGVRPTPMAKPDSGFDAMAPENISPLVGGWAAQVLRCYRPGFRGRRRHHPRGRGLAARRRGGQGARWGTGAGWVRW